MTPEQDIDIVASEIDSASSRRPLLLRERAFSLVWLSQVVSQGGTRLYQIGVLWWLLGHLTAGDRVIGAGVFLLLAATPPVLLARYIGGMVDRGSVRRIMLCAEAVAGVLVTLLAISLSWVNLPLVTFYVVALVLAICQAFFDPSLSTSIPRLVEPKDVPKATAFQVSTQPIANLTGAVLGAGLIGLLGLTGLVVVNAASYGVSVGALALARFRPRPVTPVLPAQPAAPAAEDVLAGQVPVAGERIGAWRLLAAMPVVRTTMCCFVVANFFTSPVLLVIPLYTRTVLAGSANTMASLEAALWFGLLAGAFSGGMIKLGMTKVTQLGAASVTVNALAMALPGVIPVYPIYLVTLALGGWCVGVVNVRFVAFFQEVVPPETKGRFFAAMQGLIAVAYPASCLAFGAVGDVVSPRVLCLAQGGGLLVVAIVLATMSTSSAQRRLRPGR